MEATNAIINAIEATNATVDQLVQQGNELCDDVDNLRAADERLGKEVEAIRASVAEDKEAIAANKGTIAAQSVAVQLNNEAIEANKEAIASQAKDLADLRSGLVALAKEIADLRAIVQVMHATIASQAKPIEASKEVIEATNVHADTPDMAALIARIPKPDAVRTRAATQPAVAPAPSKPVVAPAPSKPVVVETPAPRKDAVVPKPAAKTVTNAVETRAYARQYMIENGAKVEQLRDPAAIEATVASEDFAAWLAAR